MSNFPTVEEVKFLVERAQTIQTSMEKCALAMVPSMVKAGVALQQFDENIARAYEAAGAPYGDTVEGRYQWLRSLGPMPDASTPIDPTCPERRTLANHE